MNEITLTKETEVSTKNFKEEIWYKVILPDGRCKFFYTEDDALEYIDSLIEFIKKNGSPDKKIETLKTFPL